MVELTINIHANNKAEYRRKVITQFLEEECGSSEHCAYYYYYVEKLENGNRIYLKRPTQLNKGIDFEVRVENTQFRYGVHGNIISTGNRPRHNDFMEDFQEKRDEDIKKYKEFKKLFIRIYNCEDVSEKEMRAIKFKNSFDTEMILKVLKWLFIEQDVTYWNRSGREMLFNGLSEI